MRLRLNNRDIPGFNGQIILRVLWMFSVRGPGRVVSDYILPPSVEIVGHQVDHVERFANFARFRVRVQNALRRGAHGRGNLEIHRRKHLLQHTQKWQIISDITLERVDTVLNLKPQ